MFINILTYGSKRPRHKPARDSPDRFISKGVEICPQAAPTAGPAWGNNQRRRRGPSQRKSGSDSETTSMLPGGTVQSTQNNLIVNYFAAPERKGVRRGFGHWGG